MSDSVTNFNYVGDTKISVSIKKISWQRPTTNIKSDIVCVKLIEITE